MEMKKESTMTCYSSWIYTNIFSYSVMFLLLPLDFMERTTVPGGCTSVRQTIGDILSTANVVTAAATQTKSLLRILGEAWQHTATDGPK